MGAGTMQVRWSLRDLRARWHLVAVIALIAALGTGLAAGLGSMRSWRIASNDASYSRLNAHDLRVTLPEGASVSVGALAGAVQASSSADAVTGLQERLIAPAQVDASAGGTTRIVPGRLVGLPVVGDGTRVDRLHVAGGRGLGPADSGRPVAVLEQVFADRVGLPSTGRIVVGGGAALQYVGVGVTPDYFIVSRPGTGLSAAEGFAVVFTSLATAQELAGAPGKVNEVALTVRPGTDLATLEHAVSAALASRLGGLGATFTRRAEEAPHRLLYTDAENDQRLYDVFAYLVLVAAALATFNLVGRIVEAERREIGIGMALGVDGRRLAIRPMLLAAEIALLGALLGAGLGLAFNAAFRRLLEDLLPLPVLVTPFQPGVFARGALLGFLLPFAAAAYPVWRAMRVTPVEAIRVGARAARRAGWASALRQTPGPRSSIARLPLRNVARTPRRTALTALAIAVVVSALVAMAGMIDSFRVTVSDARGAVEGPNPSWMTADLDGFQPVDSATVRAVERAGVTAAVEPGVRLTAELTSAHGAIPVLVDLVEPGSRVWRPRIVEGSFPSTGDGLVLSVEAARDLGVGVGDTVQMRHPRLVNGTMRVVVEPVTISAIHPNPFRIYTYMAATQAPRFGLAGAANTLSILPAPGMEPQAVVRALARIPGVALVEPANATIRAIDDRIDDFVGILLFAEVIVLALALLIAANAAAINAEERTREHATMMAFGLRARTPVAIAMVEGLVVGVLATAIGLAIGLGILHWTVSSLVQDTLPELGAVVALSDASRLATIAAGMAATALAPLLTVRRVRRIDIPSALRVVE